MSTEATRRKILLITRNLPPLVGGMERMMYEFALGLSQYVELTVIGPRGCRQHLPPGIAVHETSPRLPVFLPWSTVRAMLACINTRFDLIIGGSGLIGPTLRILSWCFRRKTLMYLHGLDLVVANGVYQRLFVPSFRGIDAVAVNSRNTRELASEKGIDEERLVVVNPGTHLPVPIDPSSRLDFRQRHAIPFERYLVFTGRMTRRKGLSGFLQHTLPIILQHEPGSGLVVVGEEPVDSLNQLGELAEIQQQIRSKHLQHAVVFLGKLSDRDLEICYSEAAVQIFPLIEVSGDVEGFGMIAIEAAACGTPTVAYRLGGVADAISEANGYLVPPGDSSAFAERVIQALRGNGPQSEQCVDHARQFTWTQYNEKMRRIIDGLTQA
jgi:phosphatidylinositol alpha-1,6-mannosyltransferase